jgi:hypothetical protein
MAARLLADFVKINLPLFAAERNSRLANRGLGD